ncbi:ABC transporter permease [Flavobacterium sp.]|uniref:ABC transporter permease n=1 Tax=Flavobacterium sp. TaxID=239 RepID=UPI002B4B4D87|nr:FtsX-like permease family protein [Flavobacterium sp.]HLF51129.1 FtsX-like permease family protein [Flavobacterium sp.]
MNFPFYIAKRYLKSASKNNAINIINGIASLGIIVGSMALFVVLSVFSGLVNFSLSFSNDFDPDLKISSTLGKSFTVSPQQETAIRGIEGVSASSKIIEERVLFMFNGKEQVTYLKGVDSLYKQVNDIKKTIYQGQWFAPNTAQVVVGYGITQKLSLGLLDFNNPFEVFVPKSGKGTIDSPEQAFSKSELFPVGVYAISEELDSKYVFADLGLTQELLEFKPNQISGIELKLKPNADEGKITEQLQTIFNNKITIKNRAQLNDSLYKMLNTENIAVYLIFTLVIIIALFNLIGALIMMILDKKNNLKTLYNLGTEVKDLRKIFLFQGTLLSVLGGILGLILGIIVVLIQQQFKLVMITESLAYPVIFSFKNVFIVLATIVSLGFIASLIASSRVSKKLLE